ncbi:hypothetical protein M011DRAFT_508065 [Sporormia fimetaria CBS 119925]|uniref:Uncharacterized protein n=1 Tax=Sporormia fimetaria CBS 119925 TaxID=1340428 RepID=A0A6A6V3Z3_9PLEO|nr:hypothetical protein M011DRAFT_508065 [Sporormia fimetaria CBS 119925]
MEYSGSATSRVRDEANAHMAASPGQEPVKSLPNSFSDTIEHPVGTTTNGEQAEPHIAPNGEPGPSATLDTHRELAEQEPTIHSGTEPSIQSALFTDDLSEAWTVRTRAVPPVSGAHGFHEIENVSQKTEGTTQIPAKPSNNKPDNSTSLSANVRRQDAEQGWEALEPKQGATTITMPGMYRPPQPGEVIIRFKVEDETAAPVEQELGTLRYDETGQAIISVQKGLMIHSPALQPGSTTQGSEQKDNGLSALWSTPLAVTDAMALGGRSSTHPDQKNVSDVPQVIKKIDPHDEGGLVVPPVKRTGVSETRSKGKEKEAVYEPGASQMTTMTASSEALVPQRRDSQSSQSSAYAESIYSHPEEWCGYENTKSLNQAVENATQGLTQLSHSASIKPAGNPWYVTTSMRLPLAVADFARTDKGPSISVDDFSRMGSADVRAISSVLAEGSNSKANIAGQCPVTASTQPSREPATSEWGVNYNFLIRRQAERTAMREVNSLQNTNGTPLPLETMEQMIPSRSEQDFPLSFPATYLIPDIRIPEEAPRSGYGEKYNRRKAKAIDARLYQAIRQRQAEEMAETAVAPSMYGIIDPSRAQPEATGGQAGTNGEKTSRSRSNKFSWFKRPWSSASNLDGAASGSNRPLELTSLAPSDTADDDASTRPLLGRRSRRAYDEATANDDTSTRPLLGRFEEDMADDNASTRPLLSRFEEDLGDDDRSTRPLLSGSPRVINMDARRPTPDANPVGAHVSCSALSSVDTATREREARRECFYEPRPPDEYPARRASSHPDLRAASSRAAKKIRNKLVKRPRPGRGENRPSEVTQEGVQTQTAPTSTANATEPERPNKNGGFFHRLVGKTLDRLLA